MSKAGAPTQRWRESSSGLVTPAQRPPGLVVIPVSEHLRHTDFFSAFVMLHVPPRSMTGVAKSASVTSNINLSLAKLQPHHEWAFILGDDHVFPPDLLETLLDLNADIAVPLCVKRAPPYQLVIYAERVEDDPDGYPAYRSFMPEEVPTHPFPVVAAGSAGMLIRRRVLDALTQPYFEHTDGAGANEDLNFCEKARAAGFEIICHPGAALGHIGSYHIWPFWKPDDDRLRILIDMGGPPGYNEVLI